MEPIAEPEIIFASTSQAELLTRIRKVASSDAEILISGPSGVGKELYAGYAHIHSARKTKPFVALNCSNLSPELLESEIFGHARGAYTGAVIAMDGIAGAAQGGTLFLDEVDALPLSCQAKILRFAQTKEYRRLGETHLRKADIRLIAASNADLPELVKAGKFREDLYFRLRVVPLQVDPLAERREDIPVFLDHFITKYAKEYNTGPISLSDEARLRLLRYSWPGNVRELENCVRYLTCMQLDRPVLVSDLPLLDTGESDFPSEEMEAFADLPMQQVKEQLVDDFEKLYIDSALSNTSGNVTEAAKKSGKHRRAFTALLQKHGIRSKDYRIRS